MLTLCRRSNSTTAEDSHYRFLPLGLFFAAVMVSGSHSFTGSSLFSITGCTLGGVGSSSSRSACADARAISSGLTSSPRRIRAAISGVTRMRRTFVWNPGASEAQRRICMRYDRLLPPLPIPYSLSFLARYHLRTRYAERRRTGGILCSRLE